jgi:HNH endonuclease
LRDQIMTKEEILTAIRGCAKKLGRNPNRRELEAMAGVTAKVLYNRLGSMRKALEEAGLDVTGPGFAQPESVLLLDWAEVARKLQKLPSAHEYQSVGRFTSKPFHTRYGSWRKTPELFRGFTESQGIGEQWSDVLAMIAGRPAEEVVTSGIMEPQVRKGALLCDRPVYGPPLQMAELAHAPVNELGVVFVFGAMARRLGFIVHRLQAGFPDCIAMREMAPGQWQRVRIEFEFESRNFLKHRHRADRCDLIVCWRHNWKECPLEVVELREEIAKIENLPRRHGGTEETLPRINTDKESGDRRDEGG